MLGICLMQNMFTVSVNIPKLLLVALTADNAFVMIGFCINPICKYSGMLEISINVFTSTKQIIKTMLK